MASLNRIPLPVKLAYTSFTVMLVWIYWRDYGPQNFLYFCDVAVLVTLVGIWIESPLLVSMQTVAILIPQTLWILDFVISTCGLHHGGLTAYMFDPSLRLFLRGVSLFHIWLPILLIWLISRLGYDRRALLYQILMGLAIVLVCYFCFAPPGTIATSRRAVNINYVYGMSASAEQTWMPPLAWLAVVMLGIPTLLYLPAHWLLSRTFAAPRDESQRGLLSDAPLSR